LYIDINGEIYPLYYKNNETPVFVSWIKNLTHYSPTNNELLITSETIKSGIRYAKIKSVTTAGSYYITDLDMK
jgi:hypothetical protein